MVDVKTAPKAAAQASATGAPLLEVRDLQAWYGESHVLHGMNFDVRAGEVVTLLGRNGAGKTSTLKSIMGMIPKRTGSVRFDGHELIKMSSDKIARLGVAFCPEERGIFASLNVYENLILPPTVRSGGLTLESRLRSVPQPQGAAVVEPGHQAVGRRAADAGDRPHPAHRRALPDARRADRGLARPSSSSRSAAPSSG